MNMKQSMGRRWTILSILHLEVHIKSITVHNVRLVRGRRRKEEGEILARNKAGSMRKPLLNGIKWECIGTIGTNYGHNKSPYLEEGRKEEEEKDGPLIRLGPRRPLVKSIICPCNPDASLFNYMHK